ncbi:hypothetical protein REPUB_Repub15cG0124200 [Reevesia pubescens]
MNNIKGYGFRPSDEELISYLEDITFDRDSLVQYITQLEDICKFEPWELPVNYKYQNGTLIKRVTNEGYWKPTGRPRKVMASDTKAEIGSKRFLTFHKGRPKCKSKKKSKTKHDNNKDKTNHENNRNKTKNGRNNRKKAEWVMHEYQLNTPTPTNQKALFLGKLMKQSEETNISNNKGESSHHSPTNLRNEVAKDATTSEDQSDSSKPSAEVEESKDSGEVENQPSTNEQDNDTHNDEAYPQERTSTFENDDAENLYPMDLSDCDELCNLDELLALIGTP